MRFDTTNITPRRNDSHDNDTVFWERFRKIALKMAKAYPDLEFVRTHETWELRSANRTAVEAFEDLALIFCKRVKGTYLSTGAPHLQWICQVHTVGDAVQAFIWTLFSNHKIGNKAAMNSIEKAKRDFGGMLKGRLTEV